MIRQPLCLIAAALGLSACAHPTADSFDARMFRAQGNEPGWHVDIQHDRASIVLDYGQTQYSTVATTSVISANQTQYSGQSSDGAWTLTVVKQPCSDTMSDQTFDYTATFSLHDIVLRGCGSYRESH